MAYDAKTKRGTGYGKRGGDRNVHELQRALTRAGFGDARGRGLVDDGKLGPLTTQAVKAAQRALGLKPDGRVTAALLKRIQAMPAKSDPAASPKPRRRARDLMAARQRSR